MSVDWDLAGLTSEEGKVQAYVGGGGAIWVPPSVDIAPSFSLNQWERRYEWWEVPEPCLVYPLPPSWGNVVSSYSFHFDGAPYGSREVLCLLCELEEIGWTFREDTEGLLEDFIAIADGTPERIRRFALKWGPLWKCVDHRDCFWTPFASLPPPGLPECSWVRAEPLSAFRERAAQAKAAFDAAAYLLDDKPAPVECWRALGWTKGEEKLDVPLQRFFLASTINAYLTLPGRTSLYVTWGRDPKASLTVDFGLGFFRVRMASNRPTHHREPGVIHLRRLPEAVRSRGETTSRG